MCGITLFIDKQNNSDDGIIRKMNSATRHRGPDASRFGKFTYFQNTIYIGNNRLKIVDTSDDANQPFISSDGRYCLSFNGEIYNYKELRKKLELSYLFRTDSDSEVLLYTLVEFGKDALPMLNGMFAFILFDSHTGELLIGRDSHGIKPLYYFRNDQYLLVASELQGIFASGLVPKFFNEEQLPHYLSYKYVQKPYTFYKDVFELLPGHLIESSPDRFRSRKWKNEVPFKNNPSNSSFKNEVKSLLTKAVERQWQSDVPIGLFLSGGIDSTLLLATASHLGLSTIPTFSIVNTKSDEQFGTKDYLYSRKAATLYKSDHNELAIDDSVLTSLEALVASIDQPIGDSALLLTSMLSKEASKQVKVVLSGAGADEWFGGYNRHWAYQHYLTYLYKNKLFTSLISKTSTISGEGKDTFLRKKIKLWNKFASAISENPIQTYSNFCSQYSPLGNLEANPIGIELSGKDSLMEYALTSDRENYLVSDILLLTDKMSMYHSLEVRVPYLDNDLTEFVSTISASQLLNKEKKWVLKELLSDMGGQEFVGRGKEGFGMPIGKWIKDKKHQATLSVLRSKNSILFRYLDFEKIQQLLNLHLSDKKDYSSTIWSLLILALWLEREFV